MLRIPELFHTTKVTTLLPMSSVTLDTGHIIKIKDSQSDSSTSPQNQLQYQVPKSLLYFQTFFNITYYTCLSPFTIIYNKTSKLFEIRKSKYQTALCLLIQASVLFQYISHCRGLDVHLLHSNPSNYFEIANVAGTIAYYSVLFPLLWRKQKEFLSIFNLVKHKFTSNDSSRFNSSNKIIEFHDSKEKQINNYLSFISNYIRPFFLSSVFLGWVTYSVVTGLVAYHKYVILAVPRDYASRAEFVYLLQQHHNHSHDHNHDHDLQQNSVFNLCGKGPLLTSLTIWYVFIEFYIWFASYFCDLMVLTSALFLRTIAFDFIRYLERESTTAAMALEQYLCLKNISKHLNSAVGTLVLCVIISALPYYASNIETIFAASDAIRRLRIGFYCVVFFTTLVIASDGNSKVGIFKDWLLDENRASGIPQSSVILIANELSTFGLSGHGFFIITFGFFGTILSVLLTYSFIIVQFQATSTIQNT